MVTVRNLLKHSVAAVRPERKAISDAFASFQSECGGCFFEGLGHGRKYLDERYDTALHFQHQQVL